MHRARIRAITTARGIHSTHAEESEESFVKKRITVARLGLPVGALLLAMAAGACPSSATASTSSTSTAPTLAQIQTQIFDPGCSPCHSDVGRTPSAGLNLKA